MKKTNTTTNGLTILLRIFLCATATVALAANARTAEPVFWNCQLDRVLMVGNGSYFFRWGRDSWKGRGQLHCVSRLGEARQTVEIAFNSQHGVVGSNYDSKLQLTAIIQTLTPPQAFESLTGVTQDPSSKEMPSILGWKFRTHLTQMRASITPLSPNQTSFEALQESLAAGKLSIRSTVQSDQL